MAGTDRGDTRSGPGNWLAQCAIQVLTDPKVAFGFVGMGSLLLYLLVRQRVDPGFTHYWGYQVLQITISLIFLLGFSVYLDEVGGFSWVTLVVAVANTWADSFGTAWNYYDRYFGYDKMTHTLGTMAVSCAMLDILIGLEAMGKISWPRRKLVITAVGFAIGLALLWELYEFLGDHVFNTGRNQGFWDTALDIVCDSFGAIVGAWLVLRLQWISFKQPLPEAQPSLVASDRD